jgi:intracellular sulfur oxidation DsrE/DsrF family protein
MRKFFNLIGLLAIMSIAFPSQAAAPEDKPFAEHLVVLQISDADPSKQALVLNVANNLIKAYGGPDKVDIEIVAFGPGLRLLFADNANDGRIDGLADNGVRFAACGNTIEKMTSLLGKKPEINDKASVVPGGVARIIELVGQGYILVKP